MIDAHTRVSGGGRGAEHHVEEKQNPLKKGQNIRYIRYLVYRYQVFRIAGIRYIRYLTFGTGIWQFLYGIFGLWNSMFSGISGLGKFGKSLASCDTRHVVPSVSGVSGIWYSRHLLKLIDTWLNSAYSVLVESMSAWIRHLVHSASNMFSKRCIRYLAIFGIDTSWGRDGSQSVKIQLRTQFSCDDWLPVFACISLPPVVPSLCPKM